MGLKNMKAGVNLYQFLEFLVIISSNIVSTLYD